MPYVTLAKIPCKLCSFSSSFSALELHMERVRRWDNEDWVVVEKGDIPECSGGEEIGDWVLVDFEA